MSQAIINARESVATTKEATGAAKRPAVGEWYWVTSDDSKKPWLGCIVHIGTNYLKLQGVRYYDRVHATEFRARCVLEQNPDDHIQKQVERHQKEINRLTHEVKELTARLGLSQQTALPGSAGDTLSALAVRGSNDAVGEYKQALVLAKETTLPELFKAIKNESEKLKNWLTASLIPLEAQAEGLEPLMASVKTRIFNVELYAGLVETVEQIADGKPAPLSEPIHLMQRRFYMDEECLANYQVGGMDFDEIGKFDAWLCKPENRDRILPFPRCVIAFQVRRNEKDRELINLSDFINIHYKNLADKQTFLYIRNGERLYWLQTSLDFGSKLFPDQDAMAWNTGMVYAKKFGGSIENDGIIPASRYEDILEQEAEAEKFNKTLKGPRAWMDHKRVYPASSDFEPFTPDSVYYDDIEKIIQKQVDEHNRLVIVLQGLLDRSPVFHPHAPVLAWTEEGFKTFKLVYDDSRALTPGDAPDFEAYRARLNASLSEGSVTVGQDDFWERKEAATESLRLDNDWRTKTYYRPEKFRPYGNPGPGVLATVVKYAPRAKTCLYQWERQRQDHRNYWNRKSETIPCSLTVPANKVLNVSAYRPGDYKQFFNDPRTRADYLKWAPLLLRAEEYHAGNTKNKE